MRILLLALLGATGLFAQPVGVGLKVGVPLTDFFNTVRSPTATFDSATKRFLIGPSVDLRLPFGLGVEVDALYRHFSYSSTTQLVDFLANSSTTGNAWEFPVLLKYRAGPWIAKPFVAVGANFDTFSGLKQTIVSTFIPGPRTTSTSNSSPAEFRHKVNKGFVIGGGIDVHPLFLHIVPEIRYTRWGSEPFQSGLLVGPVLLHSSRNQAEFLLGITF